MADLEIDNQYEYWLINDGLNQDKLPSAPKERDKFVAWQENRKALPYLMSKFGSEGFSHMVLGRMSAELWEHYLAVEPENDSTASRMDPVHQNSRVERSSESIPATVRGLQ